MIIDSHLHVLFSKNKSWQSATEALLHHMRIAGIDQACIMPMIDYPGYIYPNQDDMIFQADTLVKMTEAYPGRFFPMLFTNPLLSLPFLKGLVDQYVLQGPLVGIKFHIQVRADDPRMDPFLDFLEQHNVPILFHSWYKTVNRGVFESSPVHIAAMAEKHPALRIQMAHLTACRLRGIQDIKKHQNVVVDTSGSQPEDGYLQRALEELGADRILYGSDYPIRSFPAQLGRIYSVEMSDIYREKLLCTNALKFYRGGDSQ